MRRETARQNSEIVAKSATAPAHEAWVSWLGLLGILLLLLHLVMLPRVVNAEPAAADPGLAVSAALLAVSVTPSETLPESLPVPSLETAVDVEAPVGDLLVVPHGELYLSDAELADESIAEAVALGTNPDLIPRSKFRKRSIDLFRTERQVEIGQREMLVRLRVRAKARRAMSVEVRF